MKLSCSKQKSYALTLMEMLVVVGLIFFLFIALAMLSESGMKGKAQKIGCVNNLHEIGVAFRIWGESQSDDFQMQYYFSNRNYGVRESVESGIAYTSFQVMSNELGTTKVLVCPADNHRFAATNFTTDFGNHRLSYFVGVDATDSLPRSILSGDDDFEINATPIRSGLVQIFTNTSIGWSNQRHAPLGNLLFSDGSVQSANNSVCSNLIAQTGLATNRLAIP